MELPKKLVDAHDDMTIRELELMKRSLNQEKGIVIAIQYKRRRLNKAIQKYVDNNKVLNSNAIEEIAKKYNFNG